MRDLGEYLQQMREARGISREEISELTRIGIQYITALEDGDYESLPPDIYVRGFIKSYGEALCADIEELLSRYEAEKPKPKARRIFSGFVKEPPPYEPPIPQSKIGKKKIIPKRVQLSSSTLFLSLILLIAVVIILVLVFRDKDSDITPITNVTDVLTADSSATGRRLVVTMTREDLTQEIILKLGDINPAWAIGRADSLNLAIVARQKTWVLVETDYRRAFRGDIEANDTMRFTAKNAFFLTMGSPSLFHLAINGFELAEWPERMHPMDLEINRGNVLQLLEGAEQLELPRPPRPAIIGTPPPQAPDTNETPAPEPQIITRRPRVIDMPPMNESPTTP